ncbi:MAG: sugar transferase [Planctomycetota bacterium]
MGQPAPRPDQPTEPHLRLLEKESGASLRWLDGVLLVGCALPVAGLMAGIAVANTFVMGDVRKVFFCQERVGWRGRRFVLLKFRTMRDAVDADGKPLSDQLRVTRFGRFLRNTHLDELPQIWNIVRGDMAFIGPRPEMVSAHEYACREVPGFEDRLAVRPGITGLAQITQGYALVDADSYATKLEIDRQFIRERSLGQHVRILVGTIFWMLRAKGWQASPPSAAPGQEPRKVA